jgi:hypothetical protein
VAIEAGIVATVQVFVPSETSIAAARVVVKVAVTIRRCHLPEVGAGPPLRLNAVPPVEGVVAVAPIVIVTAAVVVGV